MVDEIKLAADTLKWLNELSDEQLPEEIAPRMRDLVANICDFQYGFSLPLDLGLGSRSASSSHLPVERPIAPLLRWKVAFEVQANQIESFEADDHEKVGDKVYCLVGGPTWESQVSNGNIEGEGATEPNLNTSDWMMDLFSIFGKAAESNDSKLKASARRLAACWYNVAMVVSFDKVDEEDVGLSKEDVMAMLMGGMSLGDEYDDGEEFEEADDIDAPEGASFAQKLSKVGNGDDDDDDEEYVPGNPENGEAKAPEVDYATKRKQLAAALMAGQLDDEDDDEDYDPENDSNDDGEDLDEPEDDEDDGSPAIIDPDAEEEVVEEVEEEEDEETRQQRAIEFRTQVLSVIDKLGAQWPHIEDVSWLKRVLKLMAIADEQEKDWFPWGFPALDPLIASAKSSDELEQQHALSILALYQERQEAVSASAAPSN
jgi:hypothetical protein